MSVRVVPESPNLLKARAPTRYVPSSTAEMSQAKFHVKLLPVASPCSTLSSDHLTFSGTAVVVAWNVTAATLVVIGSAVGLVLVSVLMPGASAAPGLLMTASWRALRVVEPSVQVTSKATRL